MRSTCAGDLRRWRDWRMITGQTGGVMIMAPVLVRAGVPLPQLPT
ncbi:DUF6336 family protein [Streptomyces sp. NPDC000878]